MGKDSTRWIWNDRSAAKNAPILGLNYNHGPARKSHLRSPARRSEEIRHGDRTPARTARTRGVHPRGRQPRSAVLRQLLRRKGRLVRPGRGVRGRVPPAARTWQVDSRSSRTAVSVAGRDDETVSAGLLETAAA